jgi:PAS domain S-box-containing protein
MVQDRTADLGQPSDVAYEQLIEHASDPLFIVDSGGTIERVNEPFLRLSGYDRTALVGTSIDALIHESERERWDRRIQLLRNDETNDSEAWVTYLETKNGTGIPVEFEFTLVEPDGDVVGSVQDTRRQRNQQINVLNRTLRHDIRNRMNLILLHAKTLKEVEQPQHRAAADKIEEVAEEIVTLSDKARKAQKHLETPPDAECSTDLVNVTETVVEKFAIKYPDTTIETDLPARAQARAPPAFDVALTELIENAIVHHPSGSGPVWVEIAEDEDTYRVRVRDECEPISSETISALNTGNENPLQHAEGLGLWITQWVVDAVGAQIQFARRDDGEGNVVVLVFDTIAAGRE